MLHPSWTHGSTRSNRRACSHVKLWCLMCGPALLPSQSACSWFAGPPEQAGARSSSNPFTLDVININEFIDRCGSDTAAPRWAIGAVWALLNGKIPEGLLVAFEVQSLYETARAPRSLPRCTRCAPCRRCRSVARRPTRGTECPRRGRPSRSPPRRRRCSRARTGRRIRDCMPASLSNRSLCGAPRPSRRGGRCAPPPAAPPATPGRRRRNSLSHVGREGTRAVALVRGAGDRSSARRSRRGPTTR